MKKIFSFAKKKRGLSQSTSDTTSVISAGYELKEKDLGKLHKAASAGEVAKLRQLIKKHDINQLDKENRTPLHLACAGGHAESVTFLVENKSKLNICDNDNRSPLMKAVQCQRERCALILLDHDADPNLVDINGNTAIHLAALIPNISVAMHLLEHEALIGTRNKEGFTPLLLAVNENHQEMVEFLLKEGTDINTKDLAGRTSLMLAASSGQISMVKLLLQYDVDITMKEDKGWTADDYAVMNGHHACSHLIIEHGTKKKLHQSPPYYGTSKVKGVSMFSSPDHAAEAAFALGGPATDKEACQQSPEQKSRASESEKVEYDASPVESVSRGSNVASDAWPSSDEEEELDFSPKKLQKPSLAKLVNASQQSKEKINENSSKVQQMAISQPLKSNVDSEDSEEDSEDEEIIENYGLQTQPSPLAKALVVSPQAAVPSPSSLVKPPQLISIPCKGFKQSQMAIESEDDGEQDEQSIEHSSDGEDEEDCEDEVDDEEEEDGDDDDEEDSGEHDEEDDEDDDEVEHPNEFTSDEEEVKLTDVPCAIIEGEHCIKAKNESVESKCKSRQNQELLKDDLEENETEGLEKNTCIILTQTSNPNVSSLDLVNASKILPTHKRRYESHNVSEQSHEILTVEYYTEESFIIKGKSNMTKLVIEVDHYNSSGDDEEKYNCQSNLKNANVTDKSLQNQKGEFSDNSEAVTWSDKVQQNSTQSDAQFHLKVCVKMPSMMNENQSAIQLVKTKDEGESKRLEEHLVQAIQSTHGRESLTANTHDHWDSDPMSNDGQKDIDSRKEGMQFECNVSDIIPKSVISKEVETISSFSELKKVNLQEVEKISRISDFAKIDRIGINKELLNAKLDSEESMIDWSENEIDDSATGIQKFNKLSNILYTTDETKPREETPINQMEFPEDDSALNSGYDINEESTNEHNQELPKGEQNYNNTTIGMIPGESCVGLHGQPDSTEMTTGFHNSEPIAVELNLPKDTEEIKSEVDQNPNVVSSNSTMDRVQDGSLDEAEEVEEQHVGKFGDDVIKEPVIQNIISSNIQQENEAIHQKVQRDLMSELGLEEIDGEEDIESPWDSESITESLKKKSNASSSGKDQIKMNNILENQDDESPEGNAAAQLPSPKIAADKQKSELGKGDAGVIEESDWDLEETNLPSGKIIFAKHSVAKTAIQASGSQETEQKISLSEEEDDEEEKYDWEIKKDKHLFETSRVNDTVSNECPPSANKTGVVDILLSQEKVQEIDLNEDPDFDSSEESAEVVESIEKSGMLLEERYEKVWVEKEKREIASHLKSLTAEFRQSFEEIQQDRVSAVRNPEDSSGGDSSTESAGILHQKNNENTALEQQSEECDVCDNEGRILHPIPEQRESITEEFSSKSTDVGNKQQILLELQKLPELKLKEDRDDVSPFPPAGNAVSKEFQWETVKEDLVKETEISSPKEGGTDVAGYITDLDSDGDNDGSLQVHSGSNKSVCSDDENPPLENSQVLKQIKLVEFTLTKSEGYVLQDNSMARSLLPQNIKTPKQEDFQHPDVKTPETPIDDLEYSTRTPQLSSVIASKPYSDEELEEDVQRFKNEVEEEKRKNLQNRERNQLDEVKFVESAEKYEGSHHLKMKQAAEKIIHQKVNQRIEPNLVKEQVGKDGDKAKQMNTSLNFRMNAERQRESFPKERIKKQNVFKVIELGSDDDDYENRQYNQWPKQIGQELKKKDRRLALQQTSRVNGDTLSAFDDSTPSEMSQDEAGILKTSTKKANRVVTVSDDLDDLTQSSDSTADSSESPASVYRNAPLLIAQLGAEKLDSVSLLKIQNLMYEYERSVEREKSRYSLLSEKVKQLENERKEHYQTLEETREMKSKLEHQKVEWETDLNSLKFRIKQEEEKRKNAEMLYEKSREQVQKKEAQYCKEIETKQELEQTVRNLEMERRTLISNLKQLDEEQNDLQRVLSQERSARVVHEGILNNHLRKQREIEEENKKSVSKNTEALIHFSETNEREKDLMQQNCSLQDEVSVLKLELDRVRARNQEEQGKYMEENEALKERLEYLKKDLKDNEEALTQTALQCNGQLNALKSETTMLASQLEREKQSREKLETDMEIMHSRLNSALQEVELSQIAKVDGEKAFQRERDEWLRLDEKRNHEISNFRGTTTSLSQQLSKAEAKANNLDNESHRATLSLTEKNLILESVQRDLNQSLARTKELEHALHLEKEQMSKHVVRQESMQERLAHIQSDNMLLRQQLEDAHNKGIKKEQAVSDVQERFSDIFSKLRGDSERQINLIEGRNKELITRNNEQKEQIYKFENEKTERESILRQNQQELADALKKLSMSEASLEVTTCYRNELEEEKTRLQKQLDKLKSKLQNTEEKHVYSERKIQELQNALDEKERGVIASSQKMQELLSVSSQSKEGAKQLEEHVQRLEIENAKLEALLKQQTSRSEMLQKEIQETASVRGRLEDLVTSLQGVKVNLEEQLNQEVQKQVVLSQTAKDSHHLWEEEIKSRSKLGLRLSKLDREKDELAGQIESEKKKVKKIAEAKRSVETRLDQEMKRNAELQKELSRMRMLFKSTKKKLKEYESGDFVSQLSSIRGELVHRHSETEVTVNKLKNKIDELSQQLEVEYVKCRRLESTNQEHLEHVASTRSLQRNHDRLEKSKQHLEDEVARLKRHIETNVMDHSHMEQYKREMEEHARKEIKQKLEEVNLFLQTQQASQEALEQLRATNEGTVRNQLEQRIRDMESELNRVRSSQQDSLNLRESAQSEVERYKELYTEELKLRKSLAAKLDRSNERLSEANTKLLNERQRSKSLIASSIMNGSLTATPALDMGQLQSAMANIGSNMGTFNRNFSIGDNFPSPVVNGLSSTSRVESYLTKMQNALEKNISKELHQATAELDGIPTRVSPQGSAASSLKSINQDQDPVTRATQQYLEVLKKNYML